MRKFEAFFNKIATLRSNLRGENGIVAKAVIGASVDNHRTLSVKQTVEFLIATRKIKLAKELEAVYKLLQPEIAVYRENDRTDAIDIAEFVNVYRDLVMDNDLYRRSVSGILSKVV